MDSFSTFAEDLLCARHSLSINKYLLGVLLVAGVLDTVLVGGAWKISKQNGDANSKGKEGGRDGVKGALLCRGPRQLDCMQGLLEAEDRAVNKIKVFALLKLTFSWRK